MTLDTEDFSARLEKALAQGLPGEPAQMLMTNPGRARFKEKPTSEHKLAGVMALLFPRDNQPHILFMQRTEGEGLRHSGQISFPGGRHETSDASILATALRETYEEVGVETAAVKVIGGLTPLYIPVSNFMVHPFIGWLEREPDFVAEQHEVAEIIVVPLAHLLKPEIRGVTEIKVNEELTLEDVPFYDLFGRVLWGATAMISSELIELIKREFSA